MSAQPARSLQFDDSTSTKDEVLCLGREVIGVESRAIAGLVGKLDNNFYRAVCLLRQLRGNLIVTGMGKAGLIGQKLAATFSSTGTRANFLHPAEARHGDLGRVHQGDVVLVLSQSGETGEVVDLLPSLSRLGVPLIAISSSIHSTLGKKADITIELGDLAEACALGLAPSTSTTAMLAVGDALALVVSRLQNFRAEDFALNHPGGSLGRKLSHVEDHMRPLDECRMAHDKETIRQVLVACTKPGRRPGAILLTDSKGQLTGLFTDSDLARLIEARNDAALDRPICEVMKTSPTTINAGAKMSAAVAILEEMKISELPVVDANGAPLGIIDVTDVLAMMPESEGDAPSDSRVHKMRIYPSY
ncbi:MAG: KpsF/GutQ family sugar-phosphate isomerase [Planctomycetes bacterium]|nr:KpsF/GutQ family sugar-phosphate isomerase [Planctomycetota bacterium]